MRVIFICLYLVLIFSLKVHGQTFNEKYDLNFKQFDNCAWDWSKVQNRCNLNLLEDSNNSRFLSISVLRKINQFNDTIAMKFLLTKHIVLPATLQKEKNLSVSVHYKGDSKKSIKLSLIGIGDNENINFHYSNQSRVSGDWKKLTVYGSLKESKAINIYIEYSGNRDTNQFVDLKNVQVKVGKQLLNDMKTVAEDNIIIQPALNENNIIPLKIENDRIFWKQIPQLQDAKIIGLGEITHGSETLRNLRLFFLKSLILDHNCKLILTEGDFQVFMLFDLYIQSLIPISSRDRIKEILDLGFGNNTFITFLDWLRTYNDKNIKKVHLVGIDNNANFNNISIPLMDFHYNLLGEDKAKNYIKLLYSNQLDSVKILANNDESLKIAMGEKYFKYYNYVLSEPRFKNWQDLSLSRDSNMFRRTLYLDSLFTTEDEKIAILAHSGHLQKIPLVNEVSEKVLGNFLNKTFKQKYYAINFTAGSGTFIQDSCDYFKNFCIDFIRNIPEDSFEYQAASLHKKLFLYPMDKLCNNSIKTSLHIYRNSLGKDLFKFTNLPKRYDSIIFVDSSIAIPLGFYQQLDADSHYFKKRTMYYNLIKK